MYETEQSGAPHVGKSPSKIPKAAMIRKRVARHGTGTEGALIDEDTESPVVTVVVLAVTTGKSQDRTFRAALPAC